MRAWRRHPASSILVRMATPRHVSLAVLADQTGVPLHWLRREADAGRLPCLIIGRRRLFNVEAVLKSLARRQAKGGADHAK